MICRLGKYYGPQVYLDILLLSHATYFIGSDFSTLSALIANLIMSRATPYYLPENNLFYIPVVDGSMYMYENPCIYQAILKESL